MRSSPPRPPLAVTCGEPAGIGPEVVAKARALISDVPFFALGNPDHFAGHGVALRVIAAPEEAASDALCILPMTSPVPPPPVAPTGRRRRA